jgi:hypothetical protein
VAKASVVLISLILVVSMITSTGILGMVAIAQSNSSFTLPSKLNIDYD